MERKIAAGTGARRRIAIGGFQHETNTFAPTRADFAEFEKLDAWPGLTAGAALFEQVAGRNLPITGFIDAAIEHHELVPLLWCSAEPSSYVTADAFERISTMLCDALTAAACNAVYLDLHGAMVTEHLEDGEGELLRRVREVIGLDLPLVISLDLHANITRQMLVHASAITVFRTYPHVDMAATGARAYALLDRMKTSTALNRGMRKLPFLVPLNAQCTDFEPNKSIYARLAEAEVETETLVSVDFAAGFPPADIHECGGALIAFGYDQVRVDRALDQMYEQLLNMEGDFDDSMLSPADAVTRAMQNRESLPVVLADVQDNPGAGASSDTVGILHQLVGAGARGAVVAVLNDPAAARVAHSAGRGGTISIPLGGKSGQPGQSPFESLFVVEELGDGRFVCSGEMYRGAHTELGPMALLRVDRPGCDVRVLVGSERFQCLDQAVFRHLGVEPQRQGILALKSTVHFRADFASIASKILVVESPGAHPCRLTQVKYRRLRPAVRLGPNGPEQR